MQYINNTTSYYYFGDNFVIFSLQLGFNVVDGNGFYTVFWIQTLFVFSVIVKVSFGQIVKTPLRNMCRI